VDGQTGVHAGGVAGEPLGQGFGQAGDDFGVARFVVRFDCAHGFQNGGVVFGVAVFSRKAGGDHPALFLCEMFHRVQQELPVQRQLLVLGRGQDLVEHVREFLVGLVHAVVAGVQGLGPGQAVGGEADGIHGVAR